MSSEYRYNKPANKSRRQKLRNNATKAEIILWDQLSGSKLDGFKFRRQYGVGPFIVDFYCPELRLAIEVDGDSHFEKGADVYDARRQKYIEKFDIKFLRFTNFDVYENLDGVIQFLRETIECMKS